MPSHSIAYVGLNLGPNSGADDIIVGVRVVPTGKEGNVVYARTLNANESDLGERITLQVGEHLVCPAGSLKVTIDDVERYAEPGPDGYAAVTNTVWTWCRFLHTRAMSFSTTCWLHRGGLIKLMRAMSVC